MRNEINELIEINKSGGNDYIYNVIEILVNKYENCDVITKELDLKGVSTDKEINEEIENKDTHYLYNEWVEKVYDYILDNNLCDIIKEKFKNSEKKTEQDLKDICKVYNIDVEDYLYLEGYVGSDFTEYLEEL